MSKTTFKHIKIPEIEELQTRISAKMTPNGRVYVIDGTDYAFPSITTVLGRRPKPWLHEWKKRVGNEEANRIANRAATKGTRVHNALEAIVNNEAVDVESLMPSVKVGVVGIQECLEEHLSEVWASECGLFSKYLGVAGRVDLVGLWDGIPSIIDFKTSRRHKTINDITSYLLQEAAYSIMFEEITTISIPQLVTVMTVSGDPNPLIFVEKRKNWQSECVATIEAYR